MTARKSTEVEFRKSQEWRNSAILDFRRFTEVYGSHVGKPAENRTEVYGSVTEVRPPLKRATSAVALLEVRRANFRHHKGAAGWIALANIARGNQP